MKILNKIHKRTKSDNGDAIIVLGIMLITVTLIIGAMLLDITKAFQMKSAYNDAAQKATQAAIRHQNSEGYLKAESIAEALLVYETITRPATINDGFMSSCEIPRNIPITIRLVQDNLSNVHSSDYSIVVFSNQVNAGDTVETLLSRLPVDPDLIESGEFKGLEMTLTESTPNVILPRASIIGGLDRDEAVNLQCQTLGIRSGASKYTGVRGQYN